MEGKGSVYANYRIQIKATADREGWLGLAGHSRKWDLIILRVGGRWKEWREYVQLGILLVLLSAEIHLCIVILVYKAAKHEQKNVKFIDLEN